MANDWYYNTPVPQPGSLTVGGGGGTFNTVPAVPWRNQLEARRAGAIPSAEYPDGYLGNIRSRREDRLLNAVKYQLNKRSYQRGVHVGEKIPTEDYTWTPEFNPMTGLKFQAQGKKWAPKGNPVERLANDGKNVDLSPEELGKLSAKYGVNSSEPLNLAAGQAQKLRPTWR